MTWVLPTAAFIAVCTFVVLVYLVTTGAPERVVARLDDLAEQLGGRSSRTSSEGIWSKAMPRIAAPLVPRDAGEQQRLKTRVIQAGLYGPQAVPRFLAVKMLLTVVPVLLGLGAVSSGLATPTRGMIAGASVSLVGMLGSNLWLSRRKADRQKNVSRALPDALDTLVICLEGGVSLPASLARVADEMRMAHPLLASELGLVIRATDLGQTIGDALRQFAFRFDLEELRRLASLVLETDRFGTSISKAFRAHADSLRLRRQQIAEETARKAEVKMLFPTLLFILPCVFVVVLGPSVIHILKLFEVLAH